MLHITALWIAKYINKLDEMELGLQFASLGLAREAFKLSGASNSAVGLH